MRCIMNYDFNNTNARIENYHVNQHTQEITFTVTMPLPNSSVSSSSFGTQSDDKGRLAGGGNKPASEKQINLLVMLADQQRKNLEVICSSRYRKNSGQLLGREADELIKELRR